MSRPSLYLFLAEEYLHGCTFAAFADGLCPDQSVPALYTRRLTRGSWAWRLTCLAIPPLQGSALLSNWIWRSPLLLSAPVDECRRPAPTQEIRLHGPRRRFRPIDEHCHSSCRGSGRGASGPPRACLGGRAGELSVGEEEYNYEARFDFRTSGDFFSWREGMFSQEMDRSSR